jgi:hypothetical protein
MSIGEFPTVWIIGAGFSKALGGPLLADLFRPRHLTDLEKFVEGESLAIDLRWVQSLFTHGRDKERLWENAEDFLAFVDSAYGDQADQGPDRKAILEEMYGRACEVLPSREVGTRLNDPSFDQCLADPRRSVRRALAEESSAFLKHANITDEQWKPYREWARLLTPGRDSIITFNYDTLLEQLDRDRLQRVLPTQPLDASKIPIFKLHGSWDWHWDKRTKAISHNTLTILENLEIAIAAPGRAKAQSVKERFQPLWDRAFERMKHANSIVILGYGFPKTDAEARMALLDGIEGAAGGQVKQVEIVLGPDINRPESRRVLELVRHRTGHRRVFVDREPDFLYNKGEQISIVTQHPLWAEDFIGDYIKRTERKRLYRIEEQVPIGYDVPK